MRGQGACSIARIQRCDAARRDLPRHRRDGRRGHLRASGRSRDGPRTSRLALVPPLRSWSPRSLATRSPTRRAIPVLRRIHRLPRSRVRQGSSVGIAPGSGSSRRPDCVLDGVSFGSTVTSCSSAATSGRSGRTPSHRDRGRDDRDQRCGSRVSTGPVAHRRRAARRFRGVPRGDDHRHRPHLLAFSGYPPVADSSRASRSRFSRTSASGDHFSAGDLFEIPRATFRERCTRARGHAAVYVPSRSGYSVPSPSRGRSRTGHRHRGGRAPALGDFGFKLMAVAAILATASLAIAPLYAAGGLTGCSPRSGQFPPFFGARPDSARMPGADHRGDRAGRRERVDLSRSRRSAARARSWSSCSLDRRLPSTRRDRFASGRSLPTAIVATAICARVLRDRHTPQRAPRRSQRLWPSPRCAWCWISSGSAFVRCRPSLPHLPRLEVAPAADSRGGGRESGRAISGCCAEGAVGPRAPLARRLQTAPRRHSRVSQTV